MALVVKNLPANAGDLREEGLIPRSGRSPEEGHGNPLQYPCLKNPMARGAWRATVHRVTKSRTQLKQLSMHTCTYSGHLYSLLGTCVEKAMAPHSSTLAWKILWTEEPGRLQSMGSQRVGHD